MSCLSGIISLKGCSVEEIAGSVYSLNSLPGISLNTFESVANNEQKNYLGVWENINERAEAAIKNAVISNLSTRFNIKRVQRTVDTYNIETSAKTAENKFVGIVVNNGFDWVNNWVKSPFQNISIDKIRFFKDVASTATTVDIQFINYLTKEVLFTKTLTFANLSNGWNEVSILKTFNCPILAIGFNQNNITTVKYDSNKVADWWSSCIYDVWSLANCGWIKGFTSDGPTKDGELSYQQDIIGLQALITIGCSYDAAVCNNRLLFAEAMWYLLGSELMTEVMYSERINFITSVKRDQAVELKAHYDLKYEEALKNALLGLKFDCDECLQCNSLVQSFTQLP